MYALVCIEISHAEVDRLFHYAVPDNLQELLTVGMRVKIPFGKGNKSICGYVLGFSDCAPDGFPPDKIKSIENILEPYPILSGEMLTLAEWMKEKYYTTLSACLSRIEPPGLKTKPWDGQNAERRDTACRVREARPDMAHPDMARHVPTAHEHTLTDEQQHALSHIRAELAQPQPRPILVHGVTGSGKTEIYMRAIAEVLSQGKQAIMLVPEIALTPQMVSVFKKRFGDSAAVTHSRMTVKKRREVWQQARLGAVSVMIGPRSAVFAPFSRPGIIIVDEEHEHTYRSEISPKYAAAEVAIKRAALIGALVVLGSATPGLGSYYRASRGEFSLVNLTKRVNLMFPKVHIVDMRKELTAGNTGVLSAKLQSAIADTLAGGRQVILFLNRRGHSTFVSCRKCGHTMGCDDCRVNFTFHQKDNNLRCHYCGKTAALPQICPACTSKFIRYFGLGTQKIEEEVRKLFPTAATLRMDMDTAAKVGHAKILSAFRKGEAQILIGTQMIAKGLDFPKVTLVGVVAADMSLFTGDFRAAEHTFQLLTQVSGRAGRAKNPGEVYIQSYNPDHYAVALARTADYQKFYRHEIAIRQAMNYPPFTHVFMVMFVGADEREVITALHKLLAIMRYSRQKSAEQFELLGPAPAFVSKIKKQFRWKLLIKAQSEEKLKNFVLYCSRKFRENYAHGGINVHLTLNPEIME